MKCTKCSALAVINLRYLEPLCNKCFCRLIERRIRKYARVNGLFKKNDVILAVDYLSRFLVKRVIMNLPVIILFREFAIRDVIDNHKVIREFVEENKVNKIDGFYRFREDFYLSHRRIIKSCLFPES